MHNAHIKHPENLRFQYPANPPRRDTYAKPGNKKRQGWSSQAKREKWDSILTPCTCVSHFDSSLRATRLTKVSKRIPTGWSKTSVIGNQSSSLGKTTGYFLGNIDKSFTPNSTKVVNSSLGTRWLVNRLRINWSPLPSRLTPELVSNKSSSSWVKRSRTKDSFLLALKALELGSS